MAFGIGIGDVLTIIDIGLSTYNKIHDREEIIIETADRMTGLRNYLRPLREFVEDRNGLAGLYV